MYKLINTMNQCHGLFLYYNAYHQTNSFDILDAIEGNWRELENLQCDVLSSMLGMSYKIMTLGSHLPRSILPPSWNVRHWRV